MGLASRISREQIFILLVGIGNFGAVLRDWLSYAIFYLI
jgi:hypothetical protein